MRRIADMPSPPSLRRVLVAPLLACFFILPVAACKGQFPDDTAMTASSDPAKDEAPLRNLNPMPRRAFEIRVSVEDPPGPFVSVNAVAQYDVQNSAECGERLRIAGVIPRITSNEPVTLSSLSDGLFTGTVYLDRIVDEDYYGRGVCEWKLVEARVSMIGARDADATEFVAGLPADAILIGGSEATHFWRGHYPRATVTNYATFGNRNLDHVPEEKRGEFFTVTMSAREIPR